MQANANGGKRTLNMLSTDLNSAVITLLKKKETKSVKFHKAVLKHLSNVNTAYSASMILLQE